MKTYILTSFLICISSLCHSQMEWAMINDPDGFTNVRSGPGIKNEIRGKILIEDYFWVADFEKTEQNWLEVICDCKEGYVDGFIHRSRVKLLNTLPTLKKEKKTENELILSGYSLSVEIQIQKFDSSRYQIEKDSNGFVQKVNGSWPMGVDGGLPSMAYKKIIVKMQGGELFLPEVALDGIFQPDLERAYVYLTAENNIIILMDNSDGAGSYTVIWEIENGKYLGRKILTI